jgi:hypothetical protein
MNDILFLFQLLQDEMKVRYPTSEQVIENGQQLAGEKHPKSSDINQRIQSIQQHWKRLTELVVKRSKQLSDAAEAHQVLFGNNYNLNILTYCPLKKKKLRFFHQ